jgi:tRNA(fMet)-specific endonuclease VapC
VVRQLLLDTDTCIFAMKRTSPFHQSVRARMGATPPSTIFISVITEGELRTGAAKSASPVKALRNLERFLAPLTILPFDSDDASEYASIRARLEGSGKPIGPLDTLIAAQARARGLVLVTHNQREFGRVPKLQTENWCA